MNKITKFVLIATSILMLSCGTQKRVSDTKKVHDNAIATEVKGFNFNTFNAKLNIEYKNKSDKLSASATIRIKHDSIIWLSITAAFGIEVLRVAITQDSIKMINKLSKEYVSDNYDYISRMINIDVNYDIVQNLLIGNMIEPSQDIFIQDVKYYDDDSQITKLIIRSAKDPRIKLVADYGDFKDIAQSKFPSRLQFNVPDRNIRLSVEYSKILTDKQQEYPFSIPTSYSRMKG